MQITLPIPQDLEQRLQGHADALSRRAIEAVAVEAYKARLMTATEVQRLLQFPSRLATDAFLKQYEAYLPYTLEEVENDVQAIAQVINQHDHHQ